jgi:Putative Ig domain
LCPLGAVALILALPFGAAAQLAVQDVFGRSLNQHGITLVDWDGYMANPLIKVYLFAPTNAALPGLATLTANGDRLYFDLPSAVSPSGPSKTVTITNASVGMPVQLSDFPDRDSISEDYTLTIVFTDAHSVRQTNTLPIHVMDFDLQRTNEFVVTANFDRDATGVFTNALRRQLVTQAANDWTYYFTGMNLDQVKARTEQTWIWSNNFDGGYYFLNTNVYTGYLLYAYGTTNVTHRSGGEGSYAGPQQASGGVPLPIKRSGGFESEIYGNYNTLGWLFLTNDNDWLVSGNLGNETNDFYSIAHHEIGHALIFNPAHPGYYLAKTNGAFTSAAVTNYYGGPVPIDQYDHLTGAIDPDSGQGAFGYEYYGNIPRKRWTMTKLDLLCAQEVGYVLRSNLAFVQLTFPSNAPPPAAQDMPYAFSFSALGGIPFYAWDVTGGALPSGLALDPFTGALTGTPTSTGLFSFTVRVRDYHEGSAGPSQTFTLNVSAQPILRLALTVKSQGTNEIANLLVYGSAGQRQVVQVSSNLADWVALATNTSGTNLFEFAETNAVQSTPRFYRAEVVP